MKNFQKYFLTELNSAKLGWIQNPFIAKNQNMVHLTLKLNAFKINARAVLFYRGSAKHVAVFREF